MGDASVNRPLLDEEGSTLYRQKDNVYLCNGRIRPSVCFCIVIVISVIMTLALFSVITAPIILDDIGPKIAQQSMDNSALTFNKITMHSPNGMTIQLTQNLTLSNSGSFPATIEATTLDVSYNGNKFGSIEMQEMKVAAFVPTNVEFTSTLTITDVATFQSSSRALMVGSAVQWRLQGSITVQISMGSQLSFDLKFDKLVTVQGAAMQITVFDTQPTQGQVGRLTSTAKQNIYNPGYISFLNMGSASFFLKSGNFVIGTVTLPNFSVASGWNYNMVATSEMLQNSPEATSALNVFFSNWMQGFNQTLQIEGPYKSDWAPMIGIVNTNITITGSTSPRLVINATVDPNSIQNIVQTAYNPIGLPVTQSNLQFQVKSSEYAIAFNSLANATNNIFTDPQPCNASFAFPSISAPGPFLIMPRNYSSFSLGLVATNVTWCDAQRPLAALCHLYHGNGDFTTQFFVNTTGSMTVTIQNFAVNVTYSQDLVPLTWPNANFPSLLCNLNGGFVPPPMCFAREGYGCYEQAYWMTHPYQPSINARTINLAK
eukprot:TRINITY_DN3928_c0_g1_i1.p1 TRINITY_DN3928_c0_g1~~TRINITY_DN3928_c0_g1_i1.p1  ORF type:complete len:543 (-),score=130.88 TRINITY_DN3928_c0_g1_i1:18-1646(-)